MEAPDGAEVYKLVGLYILSRLEAQFKQLYFELYRDDGLAVHNSRTGSSKRQNPKEK